MKLIRDDKINVFQGHLLVISNLLWRLGRITYTPLCLKYQTETVSQSLLPETLISFLWKDQQFRLLLRSCYLTYNRCRGWIEMFVVSAAFQFCCLVAALLD